MGQKRKPEANPVPTTIRQGGGWRARSEGGTVATQDSSQPGSSAGGRLTLPRARSLVTV